MKKQNPKVREYYVFMLPELSRANISGGCKLPIIFCPLPILNLGISEQGSLKYEKPRYHSVALGGSLWPKGIFVWVRL